MRGLAHLPLLLLLAVLVSACVPIPPPADTPVVPGTRIGDFVIVRAGAEPVTYVTMMRCPRDPNTKARACVLRVGTQVNIGKAIYDPSFSNRRSLDEMWSLLSQEVLIDGRKVDLQAFGYVEMSQQGIGTVRFPNIVVAADRPGSITVRSRGTFDGASFDDSMVLTLTATGI